MPAGTAPAALEPAAPAPAGPAAADGPIASPAKDAAATATSLAPDFTLPDTNGKSHKLSDYRGKVVILEWVNHGCPFVQKHYGSGNMQALQKQAAEKGAVWLSICSSADGKQGHMTAEKWNEEITATKTAAAAVLLDPAGDVGRLYEAKTTPQMFVLDTEGRIVYRGAIDDKPTADQADIAGAKNYVTEALDAVLAGKPVETAETKPYGCSVKYAAPTR
jgi:peroxiredoxin